MTSTTQDIVGQVIDQCRVDSKLGQGGMGVVYRGWHLGLDLEVAIKVLPVGLSSNEEFIQRFYREARQAARLDHPNIVRVLNVGTHDGHHFIVMQFIDGPDLRRVIEQRGPLPASEATLYIGQALAGLDYAHNRHVIHRDIKPENLMLTPDGVIKITDFGLARGAADGDSNLTKTGQVMGTPHFMPMEQWDGAAVDHRADIYAMGVSLYYLLSGKLPLTGTQPTVIVRQLALGEMVPLVQVVPDVDPQLECIVERMMARERDKRYQTAGEALQNLGKWRDANLPDAAPIVSAAFAPSSGPALPAPPPPLTVAPVHPGAASPPPTQGGLTGVDGLDDLDDLRPELRGGTPGSELQPTVVSGPARRAGAGSGRQAAAGGPKKKRRKKKKPAGANAAARPVAAAPTPAQRSVQKAVMVGGLLVAAVLLVVIGATVTSGMRGGGDGSTDTATTNDGATAVGAAGTSGADADTHASATGDDTGDADTGGDGRRTARGNRPDGDPDDQRTVGDPAMNGRPDGPRADGRPGPGQRPGPPGDRPDPWDQREPGQRPEPPRPGSESDERRQRRQAELEVHAESLAEALAARDADRIRRFLEPNDIVEHLEAAGRAPRNPEALEKLVDMLMQHGVNKLMERLEGVEAVSVAEAFVHDNPKNPDTWTLGEVIFNVTTDGSEGRLVTGWYFVPLVDDAEHGNWHVKLPRPQPGERMPRPWQREDQRPDRPQRPWQRDDRRGPRDGNGGRRGGGFGGGR